MSEENVNGAAASSETTGPAFTVEKIYVKDVSFEVPGAPAVFNEQVQPQLQMNLNQSVQRLNDNAYEVVLGITLTCNAGDKPMYLVEVKQAGVFGLAGFDAQTLDVMLGTHCPNVLYPYARQLVSDLIQSGGFPPFFLQPINFDALYAEGLRQRAAQQGQDGLADAETAGNA
jgi:preprotein translocase subunit SecB